MPTTYFYHLPRPWKNAQKVSNTTRPSTRKSLAKIIRELKVRNGAPVWNEQRKHTLRKPRERVEWPFLGRHVDSGHAALDAHQRRCMAWAQTHPPRCLRVDDEEENLDRDAQREQAVVTGASQHSAGGSRKRAAADAIVVELPSDEEDLVENKENADEDYADALLRSFYTCYHIGKMFDKAKFQYRPEYPDMEAFSRSKYVEHSMRRQHPGELQLKVYDSRKGLSSATLEALERWRRLQEPVILSEPVNPRVKVDSLELWNSAVRNLQRLRTRRSHHVTQQPLVSSTYNSFQSLQSTPSGFTHSSYGTPNSELRIVEVTDSEPHSSTSTYPRTSVPRTKSRRRW